jgi:hypothetical protein
MINVHHLAGQRDHEKSEGQYNDDEDQQGHDQGGEEFFFLQEALKFFKEGIKDHGQEDGPYDRRKKRGEDRVEEIYGKKSEKEDEDKKDMFPFHFLS